MCPFKEFSGGKPGEIRRGVQNRSGFKKRGEEIKRLKLGG